MARGELGDRILNHYEDHPEAQTTKQIQVALNAPSQGAIGYALDRLIEKGKIKKEGGRPAKYIRTDDAAVFVTPTSSKTSSQDSSAVETTGPYDIPKEEPREVVYTAPCGFCSNSKDLEYHIANCPGVIPRAAGGKKDWGCICSKEDHARARDYNDIENAAEVIETVEDLVIEDAIIEDDDGVVEDATVIDSDEEVAQEDS